AREIARIQRSNYDSLSTRGLLALARLRGITAGPSDQAGDIIDRLRKHEGFWKRFSRKRRAWVGSLVANLLDSEEPGTAADYRFLPEDETANGAARTSLKHDVEEHGIVGGIAQRLRGAADDYLKEKLDEIEARIDAKMEEIDRRLGEWR